MTAPALTMEEAHALRPAPDVRLAQALAKVSVLDFTDLKVKLIGEGHTIEEVEEMEALYRKFLALNVVFVDRTICPTGPIDLFWHAHILDTEAYERDCKALFGRFLHHFPYFGLRGPADKANLDKTFAESVDLFIHHFGIDPTAGDTEARSCRPQNCP
jgi:hypothetical protein